MKKTRFCTKQLSELYDYIAEMGQEADLNKVSAMIKNIKDVTIEADDDLIAQTAIKQSFHEALDLSASQIEKLNKLLPWSTFISFGGFFQGAPWDEKKRDRLHEIPDPHIVKLEKWIKGKRVLEVGCHEGVYTLGLAKYAKSIVALDGRIENIIKTLVRLWLANKLKSVNLSCYDLEDLDVPRLNKVDNDGYAFDFIHHNGVLYHLSNPLAHLDNLLVNNPAKTLFLDTHIAEDSQCNDSYMYKGNEYKSYSYKEPDSRSFSPFAGLTSQASWLRKNDLLEYLGQNGFQHFEENTTREERNGLRCKIICSRT